MLTIKTSKYVETFFLIEIIKLILIVFQLDTALSRMYNYLQRFAVGLEEVVIDQALFDGEFIQEFNEAEYKLKAVSLLSNILNCLNQILPTVDV